MKIKCSRCSEEHDLSQMEPSFALPDCIAAMSTEERTRKRVLVSKDICCIQEIEPHWFIRVLLPIPVQGDAVCNWGLWIEMTRADFIDIVEVWTDPALLQIKRPGKIVNELATYSETTLGLRGLVSFPDMKSIGRFELLHDMERDRPHRLVSDQRDGVTQERKLEWLLANIHPAGSN